MKNFNPAKEQSLDDRINLAVIGCGVLTAFVGGFFLVLWYAGFFEKNSPGEQYVPMADETALVFLLFGLSLASYRKSLESVKLKYFIRLSTLFIILVAILSIIDYFTGYRWNLSNFLGKPVVMIGPFPSGIISISTASSFLLLSFALLLLRRKTRLLAVIFALVTLLIGYLVIIGYVYKVPLLYGGTTIPMAMPTAILFLISSIGLLLASGKETFPIRYFIGGSVRARLFRILIPTIFILSQLQGFFLSLYSGQFGSSFALANGISTLSILFISGFIVFIISRSIGTSIDKNLEKRRLAEEALVQSEANFRKIFEDNSAAIAIIEQDTTISMVNDEYCKLSGYTRQEVIGTSWTQQIPPENLKRLMEINDLRLINPNDAPNNYEISFYHKNGEVKHAIMSITLLGNGKRIASFAEITARKIEEQKLSQLAAIVESSVDIIMSQTLDGMITSWNKGAETIYGYTAGEMIDQPIARLVPPGTGDQTGHILEKIKSGIVLDHFETVHQRKDGQLFPVSISVSPIRNKAGEIIGASTIGHDITIRKKMEEELNLKTEQLIKLNAEKDKFFSIIAHDLRSPFNGFLGLTEALVNELPQMTTDEIQEVSKVMNRSATNLYNLLGNLLEWSNMQRGFTNIVPATFLLRPKVDQSLTLSMEAAEKKKIETRFNIPEDLSVYAEPNMFESIIRNIANNAVKFTPRGGNITISAQSVSDHEVLISVQDTGIGMNQQIVDDLFLIDVNTSRKGTEGELSTGLGLIICKDFIEKHGGKLWVESEEGKGSIFRFTLPSNAGN